MSQQINLVPPALIRKRRTSTIALVSAVVIATAVAALGAAYEQYQLRRGQAQVAAAGLALKDAQARRDALAAGRGARKPDAAREAEYLDLLAQVKRRQDIIDTLKSGALGSTAGFSEFMRAFSRQNLNGVWLTGFEIDAGGKELTLAGRALGADLVPRYLEGLNRESLMQGRQFSSLRIEQPAVGSAPPAPVEPGKDVKSQPRPALRYLEFSMSTLDRDSVSEPRSASVAARSPPVPARAVLSRSEAEPAKSAGAPENAK